MIYTLTLNPSIDYLVAVDGFIANGLNRTKNEEMYPGGKGINVSLVLQNLGVESIALGFLAGFTGAEIERLLNDKGIQTDFVKLKNGNSRINVKVREVNVEKNNHETEINGQGPIISEEKFDELMARIQSFNSNDTMVIAGAVPASMPSDTYKRIINILNEKGAKVVVDASGEQLKNALLLRPYLVKPNNHELGELFSVVIDSRDKAIEYARKMQQMGGRNVLVSLGAEGAVLVTEDGQEYCAQAPKGEVINTIGAGDSMVAGFLAGLGEIGDIEKAFLMAICTGSASAFSMEMATKEKVDELMRDMK